MELLHVNDADATSLTSVESDSPNGDMTELDGLLRSYQVLQTQNGHVRSVVASSLGIGVSDLRALLHISGAQDVTPKQVGAFLELTSGAVTNLVDRMTEAGLVHRKPHPTDRRSVVLLLAPKGTESVSRIRDFYRRAFGGVFTAEQLPAVTTMLDALADALARTVDEDITRVLGTDGGPGESV